MTRSNHIKEEVFMKHIMRHRWLSAFTLVTWTAFSLLPMLVHAEPAPPAPPPSLGAPPPPPVAPPPPPQVQPPVPPMPAGVYGQPGLGIQGTVRQYLMNPEGEVDGLLLNDGTQVHFPPHMAIELVSAIKLNDPVNVQGN